MIGIVLLYATNIPAIMETFARVEGAFIGVPIILVRIAIMSSMTFYMFNRWFAQEEQFPDDIPFLFAVFLLVLTYGKAIDLFGNLTFFTLEEEFVLFILKVRFFLLIVDLIPMIFLSIGMILFSLSYRNKFKKLQNESYLNRIRERFIFFIVIIEIIVLLMAPDITTISLLYPIVAIPSLITIVWLFNFAYKHKKLSQVNPFILTVGFGALLASQIFRPLMQLIIGTTAYFIILVEIIDLIVFGIIFVGFYMKANYSVE